MKIGAAGETLSSVRRVGLPPRTSTSHHLCHHRIDEREVDQYSPRLQASSRPRPRELRHRLTVELSLQQRTPYSPKAMSREQIVPLHLKKSILLLPLQFRQTHLRHPNPKMFRRHLSTPMQRLSRVSPSTPRTNLGSRLRHSLAQTR